MKENAQTINSSSQLKPAYICSEYNLSQAYNGHKCFHVETQESVVFLPYKSVADYFTAQRKLNAIAVGVSNTLPNMQFLVGAAVLISLSVAVYGEYVSIHKVH